MTLSTTDPVPIVLLSIKLPSFVTQAGVHTRPNGKQFPLGQVRANGVQITGALLGSQVLKLQGTVAPNQVLLDTPVLKITAHEVVSATNAQGTDTITVNGIDVALKKVVVLGRTLSGNIIVEPTSAF